jgi:hypothetical protein
MSRPWFLQAEPVAASASLATALVLGVPSDVIPNPWFERKAPTRTFEVVVLVALSLVAGATAATYARPSPTDPRVVRTGASAGVAGWLAVSCPVCNPIVVAMLGTSGAAGWFSRWQPALGALAVILAAAGLALRLRAVRRGTCSMPASRVAALPGSRS